MQKGSAYGVDKKVVAVLVLILVVLVGGFVVIYVDLKADIDSLKNDNAGLSSRVKQLRNLLDALHANETTSLSAVAVYNLTKSSVVVITTENGQGSGFVYDSQGHIVTNDHVIAGATTIRVTFFDGNTSTAQTVGTPDVYSDLAVLQVGKLPGDIAPLIIRNSTDLMVGEPVFALGNPFGFDVFSLTSGIVSQVGRVEELSKFGIPPPEGNYSIADVIQFDASVNHGNSGGPLLDGFGYVIGITFAIEPGDTNSQGFIGIAYAIPSVLIMRVIPALISPGHYDHPWVGVEYDPHYVSGVYLKGVMSGGPADKAGLKVDDVIKKADGIELNRGDDFVIYLERYKSPGDTVSLTVQRDGNILPNPILLTLGTRQTAS